MAQLKDTIVSGNLRVTDTTLTDTLQVTTIKAPTSSGGSTYGPGDIGQVLKSNGTSVYWGSDSNSVTGVKGNAESSYRTGNVNLTPANIGALASTTKYAGSSSVGGAANSANVLNKNTRMDYGWDGVNYFNINGTAGNAAKVNDTPTTAWWHIMRFNNYNSSGYYTDLAIPFGTTSLYYKRITAGSVQNGGWVKVLDALNVGYVMSSVIKYDSHARRFTSSKTDSAWNAQAYSNTGYADNVYVSFRPGQTTMYAMIGLDANPSEDDNYDKIDYCWYIQNNGALKVYESGTSVTITGHTTYASGDEFRVEYSCGEIRYYHNGTMCRSVYRPVSGKLFFDSSFHNAGNVYDFSYGTSTHSTHTAEIITSTYKSSTYVASLTSSVITLSDQASSFGGWICGPTKNGRIAISSYQGDNDKLYFGYGERGRTTNSYVKAMTWDGPTNTLTADKFVGALQGNADTATSATKATQDGGGNTISSTYLKLSGGTMTGDIEYAGDGNRKIALGKNSFKYYVASNAGWAGGLSYYSNDGSTGLGYFGAYGQANTLEYHFIGGAYNAPQIKIEPTGPNLIINSEDASTPMITFFRKGSNKVDWRIVNTGGNLKFQSDYTTTVGDWYNALTVEYNTGNITMKTNATFTFGKFVSASANANRHVFFKEDNANRICVNDNFKYNPSTNILTVGSINGNAATATKLETARNIALAEDFAGSADFDGSGNISISGTFYRCSATSNNTANYPWHRIAYRTGVTGNYNDIDAIFMIRAFYNGGPFGIIKVTMRTNGSGANCQVAARWLVRQNIAANDVYIAQWGKTGQSVYADIFLKGTTYNRAYVYQIAGNRLWTLVNSNEASDTTTSDKKTSTEVYASIAAAGTTLHNREYTQTVAGIDEGHVNSANSATYATRADYVNVVAGNEIRFYNNNQLKANDRFWIGYSWADGSHYTPSGGSDTSSTTAPNITKFIMGNCSAGGLASVHAKTFILGNGSSPTYSSKTTTIATAATTTDRTITLPDASGTLGVAEILFNTPTNSTDPVSLSSTPLSDYNYFTIIFSMNGANSNNSSSAIVPAVEGKHFALFRVNETTEYMMFPITIIISTYGNATAFGTSINRGISIPYSGSSVSIVSARTAYIKMIIGHKS